MPDMLGQILLEMGYVGESDIRRAISTQKMPGENRRIGEILMDGGLGEDELTEALAKQFGMPLAKTERFPDALPLETVSFDFLKDNLILPLGIVNGTLEVATSDPAKKAPLNTLSASFDYILKVFVSSPSAIQAHLNKLEESKGAVMQRLLENVSEDEAPAVFGGNLSHLRDLAQEQGIIRLVDLIIENSVKERASDIHVEPQETSVRVRYRIDGILYERETLPLKTQAALSSRIKLLSQMNIAERRLPQDGRIKGHYGGKDIDIRVSTLPTIYGESIVMRILDRETAFISLEELGFDKQLLEQYNSLINMPYGMLLITGPTGSGKTTTLYASLDMINSPEKKIITVEDPVEYLLAGINQIQVKPKIGLTFANGLRHIVRQDPDIVMVGEIRDLETATISIHASLTGHLLFSTLHTNDASSAVSRLLDMGVENYLISSTLTGVMAQRLVRKICPACSETMPVPDEFKDELGAVTVVARGRGCTGCMQTGHRGRVAVAELLVVNDEIRDLIMARATSREIKDKAVSLGMRTMFKDGMQKVKQGLTTLDEVLRITQAEL